MDITTKIKIMLLKRKTTISKLGDSINSSQSNLSKKFKRNNFSVKEMEEIANALNYTLIINFQDNDTGEII